MLTPYPMLYSLVYAPLGGELRNWSGLATIDQLIGSNDTHGGFIIRAFIATHRRQVEARSLRAPNGFLSKERNLEDMRLYLVQCTNLRYPAYLPISLKNLL